MQKFKHFIMINKIFLIFCALSFSPIFAKTAWVDEDQQGNRISVLTPDLPNDIEGPLRALFFPSLSLFTQDKNSDVLVDGNCTVRLTWSNSHFYSACCIGQINMVDSQTKKVVSVLPYWVRRGSILDRRRKQSVTLDRLISPAKMTEFHRLLEEGMPKGTRTFDVDSKLVYYLEGQNAIFSSSEEENRSLSHPSGWVKLPCRKLRSLAASGSPLLEPEFAP